MPKVELLTHERHKGLRLNLAAMKLHNAQVGNAMIIPSEFVEVQREFPIFFRKNLENGQFYACAMLGLEQNENLFLNSDGWDANYIPLSHVKGPFLIGFQKVESKDSEDKAFVYVDVESPYVNDSDGVALFDESGAGTETLDKISEVLAHLNQGVTESVEMFSAFSAAEIIEPLALSIQLDSGEKLAIEGIYTINEERVSELSAEALFELNKSGFLRHAFTIVNSLNNVKKLIDKKNNAL